MKTMTCKQLGGACEEAFTADTFEEIVEISKRHGMKMFQEQDVTHFEAMKKVQELMQNPEDMQKWFEEKRKDFEALSSN